MTPAAAERGTAVSTTFQLQILHASDLEGDGDAAARAANFAAIVDRLEDGFANTIVLSGGDNGASGAYLSAGGDPSVAAALRAVHDALFGLPADTGDGSLHSLSGLQVIEGRIDIAIMNAIGFDASVLGNREFDFGTAALRDIIAQDIPGSTPESVRWLGALFPHLSANLDFAADTALAPLVTDAILETAAFVSSPYDLAAARIAPKIAPSAVITVGGERIGLVGATTPLLETSSSPGATTVRDPGAGTTDMAALAAVLQPAIDALTAQGIDKVILVSHLQNLALDQAFAPLLHGVDVIVAGGSLSLLADDEDVARGLHPGDVPAGTYPIVSANADGDPLLIVNTAPEYSYVGRLVLEFDADGRVIPESVDPAVSGAFAADDATVAALWGADDPFAPGTRGTLVGTLVDAVDAVVTTKDSVILGRTEVFLEGRLAEVRTQETRLGDLAADADLWTARQADPTVTIALRNGGGLRDPIGTVANEDGAQVLLPPQANPASGKEAGEISQLDVENALRFNNGLELVTVTAAQLAAAIEHAVALQADPRAGEAPVAPGRFPHVSGLAFAFDPARAPGDRVVSLAVVDDDGTAVDVVIRDGALVGDPQRDFRMVTIAFLLNGGDGYPLADFIAADPARADRAALTALLATPGGATFAAPGTEQDSLAEYLLATFSTQPYAQAETPPAGDARVQNLAYRQDLAILEPVAGGGAGADSLAGTAGNDRLIGFGGDDTIRGLAGHDVLVGDYGTAGNDSLAGDDGSDTLVDDAGADTLLGGEGSDLIAAGGGDDRLDGGAGDDSLYGGIGRDTVLGGDGADALHGEGGEDSLDGGAGDDTIHVSGGGIADGGAGTDLLVILSGVVAVDLADAGNQNAGAGPVLRGFEAVSAIGSTVPVTLAGPDHGSTTLIGGAAADTILGGPGDDLLLGFAGADLVSGGLGNDTLMVDAGGDTLTGGAGADSFYFPFATGSTVITDFTPADDTVVLGFGLGMSGTQALAALVQQGDGVLLPVGDGLGILFVGRSVGDFSIADFAIA